MSDTIFVSGFDKRRTDIEDVYNFFKSKYGPIKDIQHPKDPKTGRKQAFLFIEFEDAKSAENAVSDTLCNLQGAKLIINYKIKKES